MPSPNEFLNKAIVQWKTARHLLDVTYPLVKDSKLFLGIISNISTSLEACIDSLLHKELESNNIEPYQEKDKIQIFHSIITKKHNIPTKHSNLAMQLKDIIKVHQKSPIEFERKERMVICDNDYNMTIISVNELKKFAYNNEELINHVFNIINRKE